jgi:hypothetical protein
MTAVHRNGGAETIYGQRPISHAERNLTKQLAIWVNEAFANRDRPVFMLTLTCRTAKANDQGGLAWLTSSLLQEAMQVYFRRMDWQVYKNASRRGKQAIERFCVVEGGAYTGKRIHVHLLVLAPPRQYMEPMEFVRAMLATWRTSPWGLEDADWTHAYDPAGATRYLLKTGLDAVDWHNTLM